MAKMYLILVLLVIFQFSSDLITNAKAYDIWFDATPTSVKNVTGDSSLSMQRYENNYNNKSCKTCCGEISGCSFFIYTNTNDSLICYFYGSSYSLESPQDANGFNTYIYKEINQ